MPSMTAEHLVQAVTELTADPAHPITSGDAIRDWCADHGIDPGDSTSPTREVLLGR
jgi:hypothetical protein